MPKKQLLFLPNILIKTPIVIELNGNYLLATIYCKIRQNCQNIVFA